MVQGAGDDQLSKFRAFSLPHKSLDGLWESLVFEDDVKPRILNYVRSSIELSEKGVDNMKVAWSKLVMLTGQPGSGKTSLCKALCQKLSIQLANTYSNFDLIELNSQAIFSKWFSESGKMVSQVFREVRNLATALSTFEDDNIISGGNHGEPTVSAASPSSSQGSGIPPNRRFVFLLIDEVESLTISRSKSIHSSEPTDAVRVVNTILTEIDKLRHLPNVFVLTTSNLCDSIDSAFLDRVDLLFEFGHPSQSARYHILTSALCELIAKTVIIDDSTTLHKSRRIHIKDDKMHDDMMEGLESSANEEQLNLDIPAKSFFSAINSDSENRKPIQSSIMPFKKIKQFLIRNSGVSTFHDVDADSQTNLLLCETMLEKQILQTPERVSVLLWKVCLKCGQARMSGRALRRHPFMTYATLFSVCFLLNLLRFGNQISRKIEPVNRMVLTLRMLALQGSVCYLLKFIEGMDRQLDGERERPVLV